MYPSSEMQVISVNVGLPREVVWKGRTVVTGIFKEPVVGRVAVRRLNLEGDRQADLTITGLLDETVHIGDRFQVGSAHVMVTQPRLPCYKLGLKFGRDDILKRFLQSGLTGFYFAVLKEGEVAAGDPIRLLHRDEDQVKVADITRLYREEKHNLDLLRRVVRAEALPQEWRDYFRERLTQLAGFASSNETWGSFAHGE